MAFIKANHFFHYLFSLAYFDIKALIDGETFVVGLAIREQYSLHKMWIDIKDTCCGYLIKDANEVSV